MKFQGRLKAITFKDERVSVLLEDARIFTDAQIWEDYTDLRLVKSGKYKKGEVWMSAFEGSAPQVYQACRELEKGVEVDVSVVENKGFFNITGIRLKMREVDVNEDLQPEFPEEEPSSEQRPPDSPEAQAEEMLKEEAEEERASNELDKRKQIEVSDRDISIIRQCCIKAVGAMVNFDVKNWADLVALAMRLEKYVLEGK